MRTHRFALSRRTVLLSGAAFAASFGLPSRGFADEATIPGMSGKVVLITGSTDGLGKAVALQLANAGAHIIVHGRNRQRGEALKKEIDALNRGGAMFYAADFSSMAAVRGFAAAVAKDHKQIHLLINNAGIGSTDPSGGRQRELSPDGYELRFAVNYLATFLLTRQLLPVLVSSAPARIVNVASLAQRPVDFTNVMLEREYDGGRAYGQSKLAQILFTVDLAEELQGKGVTANALHPATYMDTAMVRSAGVAPRSTVEQGADAVVYVATSPDLDGQSGQFFNGKAQMRANAQAYDAQARKQLRELSAKLTSA